MPQTTAKTLQDSSARVQKRVRCSKKGRPRNLDGVLNTITQDFDSESEAQRILKLEGFGIVNATDLGRTRLSIFGPLTVSKKLPFHQTARLTAAELVVFFPEHIRSPDLIDRLITNGGDAKILMNMINFHRIIPKDKVTYNAMLHLVLGAMRRPYPGWNIPDHKAGKFKTNHVWTAGDLTMKDKKTMYQECPDSRILGGPEQEDVPLISLAKDVRFLPDEHTGDGFEVTRAVQFALANPDLPLQFLRDFEWLNNELGPLPMNRKYEDAAVFERWEQKNTLDKNITLAEVHKQIAAVQDFRCSPAQKRNIVQYLGKIAPGHIVQVAEEDLNIHADSSRPTEHSLESLPALRTVAQNSSQTTTPPQIFEANPSTIDGLKEPSRDHRRPETIEEYPAEFLLPTETSAQPLMMNDTSWSAYIAPVTQQFASHNLENFGNYEQPIDESHAWSVDGGSYTQDPEHWLQVPTGSSQPSTLTWDLEDFNITDGLWAPHRLSHVSSIPDHQVNVDISYFLEDIGTGFEDLAAAIDRRLSEDFTEPN